jgi:hypothetical protein
MSNCAQFRHRLRARSLDEPLRRCIVRPCQALEVLAPRPDLRCREGVAVAAPGREHAQHVVRVRMDALRPRADVGGIRRGCLQGAVEGLGLGRGVLHGLHPLGHDPGRHLVGGRRPGDEQRESREPGT